MNPLEDRIRVLEDRLNKLEASDRYTVQKSIQMFDGRNVQLGTGTGTQIGTSATQKLGFFGATPIVQGSLSSPGSGSSASDGVARTAIIAIQTLLHNYGLTS